MKNSSRLGLVIIVEAPKQEQLVPVGQHAVSRPGGGALLHLQLLPAVAAEI